MTLETVGGQHRAAEAEVHDRPSELLDGRFGHLHRQQRHPVEASVGLDVGRRQPIVVGAGEDDRHLRVGDRAARQAGGGIEHRALDPDTFHEGDPLRRRHLAAAVEADDGVAEAGVQVVERREQPDDGRHQTDAAWRLEGHVAVVRRKELDDLRRVLLDVAVTVDDAPPAHGVHRGVLACSSHCR